MADANRLAAALRYQQDMEGPVTMNPNIAEQGRKGRANMAPPTSVMDPRSRDYERRSKETENFLIGADILTGALPFAPLAKGAAMAAGRYATPKVMQGMENYMGRTGMTLNAAPQDEALRLAQQRAALPVKQGGLGLPADNTPAQRAAAMGFDTDVYHGTTNDFNKFAGRHPTYAAEEPRIADIYANATTRHMSLNRPINAGPNIMPLKLGGKEFSVSDLGEGGGGWYSDNLAEALGIPRARGAVNELPNYGIDRLKVTDMGDLGGVQTQHMIPSGSDNIRSRFAAFDPWRRNSALAAALGVAAPDLLAEEK
jgi:hypothetical protein